jgi:hypothetical protein
VTGAALIRTEAFGPMSIKASIKAAHWKLFTRFLVIAAAVIPGLKPRCERET